VTDIRNLYSRGDALLIVDVQTDFCPGGALPVSGGDEIVPVLNRWIEGAREAGIPVFASRDWHPAGHVSFRERGGPWPPHCVQESAGAAFHADLRLPSDAIIVSKGTGPDRDQYSALDETELVSDLKARGVKRLWIGGLAEDVCVRATVLDARRAGFEVNVIRDATRPISPEGGLEAEQDMREAGAVLV